MKIFDYDLFVLGAGSGGVRAARLASSLGANVAICEGDRVGGTCVIRGCIPKKLLVYAAHYSEDIEDSRSYGWDIRLNSFDWGKLIDNKNTEIDRLNKIYKNILLNNKVKLYENNGFIIDEHSIQVDNQIISAEKILIATGGVPYLPKIEGIDEVITSNEAFHLKSLPKKIVIVGGGYIAIEFATIFNGLGSDVTLVYRGSQILKGFDEGLRNFLASELEKKGIALRLLTNVDSISNSDKCKIVNLDDGSKINCETVMYATGRIPNTKNLGLDNAGVRVNSKGAIITDDWHQTSNSNIYAIGDVTDKFNLTPVALNEGICFAETVFGKRPKKMDYSSIPTAIFSLPNAATVGIDEELAREKYSRIDIYESKFRSLKHTLTQRNELTFMKIIVESETNRVVGFHMVGPEAGEIIQGMSVALKMGVTKAQLDSVVGVHPSSAEEFVTMRDKLR